jgi:hypothetical protein
VTGKRAPGGSLTVVGTGIRAGLDTTAEARLHIERGDPLLYLVNDPVTEGWLRRLNPGAATLADAYRDGAPRLDAYREMADRILAAVRAGGAVCVAFYGHPGIFVRPGHEAVRRAAAEGYPARMVPGVSAEDWLFADLGVDPADRGCQSFEATDFLLYRRRFDPRSALVLWQVGGTGDRDFRPTAATAPAPGCGCSPSGWPPPTRRGTGRSSTRPASCRWAGRGSSRWRSPSCRRRG